MSSIPKHMQVTLTNVKPSEELLEAILSLPWHRAKQGVCNNEYLEFGDLFISIMWKRYPFARHFRHWECITVEDGCNNDTYALCVYDDFTRMYRPGEWEKKIFQEELV